MREFIVELVAADTYVFIAAGSNVAHMIQEVSKDATVIVASLEVLESAGVTGTIPRPQGNVTGLSTLGAELITKRLTFLREVIPGLRKVVAVAHPRNRNHPPLIAAFCQSAARLEIETIAVDVSRPEDIVVALADAKSRGVGAAMFLRDFLFETHRQTLVEAALAANLPSNSDESAFVHLGGLTRPTARTGLTCSAAPRHRSPRSSPAPCRPTYRSNSRPNSSSLSISRQRRRSPSPSRPGSRSEWTKSLSELRQSVVRRVAPD